VLREEGQSGKNFMKRTTPCPPEINMETRPDQAAFDLTAALAALPIERQTALEHTVRRRILRRLHRNETPQTPVDLATRENCPLSSISYHARVLTSCGLISSTTSRRVRGNMQPWLVSAVREDRGICSLLAATEAGDGGT
jgi:DNA-binding transcriptional ArsR family regulator